MDEQPASASEDAAHATEPLPLSYASTHIPGTSADSMTRGDIASLIVKVIGFYQIAQALPGAAAAIQYFQYGGSYLLAPIVTCAIHCSIGLFLILKGDTVARWLLPRTAIIAAEPEGNSKARFQAIAFSILGLWLCVVSIPDLAWQVAALILVDAAQATRTNLRTLPSIPGVVYRGIETGLGLWLFFGSKRLSKWWWSLRNTEFTPDEPKDAPLER